MTSFIGDYTCKVDAKGRIMLPATFKKQMPAGAEDKFVVKKDIYENCLTLFPIDEWKRQNERLRKLANPYSKEGSRFLRGFYKGAAEIELDASNRFLVPRRLLDEVNIAKEAVLAGQDGKIELWNKNEYEGYDIDVKLAEKFMRESMNNDE